MAYTQNSPHEGYDIAGLKRERYEKARYDTEFGPADFPVIQCSLQSFKLTCTGFHMFQRLQKCKMLYALLDMRLHKRIALTDFKGKFSDAS